jgi:WD40 repeat protein
MVISVKLAPGNKLISEDTSGSIKIWDRESGEYIKTINEHTHYVTDILINSNDSHLHRTKLLDVLI